MVYTPVGWQDGTGPTTYPGLVQMDTGIVNAHTDIATLQTRINASQGPNAASVAALQAATGTTLNETRQLLGYYAVGDGGEGIVVRTNSNKTVDGGSVFSCGDGGTARWERIFPGGVISVRQFGAKGDYHATTNASSDDTTYFQKWAAYVKNAQRTTEPQSLGENQVGNVEAYVPPGSYRITAEDSFLLSPGPSHVKGLKVRGAGRHVSHIYFQPTVPVGQDRYLWKNTNVAGTTGGRSTIVFEDISFQSPTGDASFCFSNSTDKLRNITHINVDWQDFRYGYRTTGANHNSEFRWTHCGVYGNITHWLWVEGTDQSLNFQFTGCDFELWHGNVIRMSKGGNVNIIGGNYIIISPANTTEGTLFWLESQSANYGVQRFYCEGVRFELRNANAKVIKSEWWGGNIDFVSCDMSVYAYQAWDEAITATFNRYSGFLGPIVRWQGCNMIGKHEYGYATGAVTSQPIATYDGCEFIYIKEAKDFLTFTNLDANTEEGGLPMVSFDNCHIDQLGLSPSRRVAFDSDVNWHLSVWANHNKRRTVSFKTTQAKNPTSTATTVSVRLPLNAVVTKAILYAPAFGTSTQTAWSFTIRTTEGTPTTLVTAAGGGSVQLQAGFKVVSADLFHVCDTDAKRDIDLVANASVDQSTNKFLALVEYIG